MLTNLLTLTQWEMIFKYMCIFKIIYNMLTSKKDLVLTNSTLKRKQTRIQGKQKYVCVSQSVQSLSRVRLFVTPWITAHQASLSITNSQSSPKLTSSSWWCHPAISSSVIPFSCPQSFPASGSFPMSQLFAWGGQSIGVSASASVLPMNNQDWSPLGWTGWICIGNYIYI